MATCEQCIYLCKKGQNSTSKVSKSRAPLFHFLLHHFLVIFSPHPPDGGLDHKLSFILCSMIINKKDTCNKSSSHLEGKLVFYFWTVPENQH